MRHEEQLSFPKQHIYVMQLTFLLSHITRGRPLFWEKNNFEDIFFFLQYFIARLLFLHCYYTGDIAVLHNGIALQIQCSRKSPDMSVISDV